MDEKTPAAADTQDERTTKIGNAIGAVLVAALAALFLYGYIPHFLFG
jgi:hypothetical protein